MAQLHTHPCHPGSVAPIRRRRRGRHPIQRGGIVAKHLLLGVWGRSSYGTLRLLTEGVTPLLQNHSERVGFPTTLCKLRRAVVSPCGEYTRHTAILRHRMTHNHSPKVREVTTIRLRPAQRARTGYSTRRACPPTPASTSRTSYNSNTPLAVICGDLNRHPNSTIDPMAPLSLEIYATLPQMRVLRHTGAHHTPFLQLPEWPQYTLFHQYLA